MRIVVQSYSTPPSFCCSYNPTFRPKHNYKLKHFATIEDSFVLMHTSTRNSIASCSPHFLSFAFDHILFYFNLRNINKYYFTHFFWHNPLSRKKKMKTSARLSIIQKYKFCWLWLKFARTEKSRFLCLPLLNMACLLLTSSTASLLSERLWGEAGAEWRWIFCLGFPLLGGTDYFQ